MKWTDPGVWVDIVSEFIFNGANFLLGYTIANGQVTVPSKAAVISACLTGLLGVSNHLRALRRMPVPAVGVTTTPAP